MTERTFYVTVALTGRDIDTNERVGRDVMATLNRVGEGLPGMDPRLVSIREADVAPDAGPRTGLMYRPGDIPREVDGRPVLAFLPLISYTEPSMTTVPSGVLARAIVADGPAHYRTESLAWDVDTSTWQHDGSKLVATYRLAEHYLTLPRVRTDEFRHSI